MTSDWELITQDAVTQFGRLSGDEQWIHMDVDRANKEMPETGTIAHGLFVVSLFPKWIRQMDILPVVSAAKSLNYGFNKIRFITPVPVGRRVRAHVEIKDSLTEQKVTKITYLITVELENQDRPAVVAESIIHYTAHEEI